MKPLQKAGNNTLFSNSLLIFLIRFFPALATTFIIILFSRELDETAYGIYQNFWIQLYLLSTLACMGLQAFLLTYTPSFIAGLVQQLSPRFYSLFLMWIGVNAAVFGYLQSSAAMPYWLPFCFLVVYAVTIITESLLIALKRLKFTVCINIVYTLVFFFLHWLLLKEQIALYQLFVYLLLLSVSRGIVCTWLAASTINSISSEATDQKLTEVKKLWVHLGFYDVSQMLFKWIDKFIISILLTAELSAIYFNGSVDIPFLPLLLGAVSSAVLMQLASTNQKGDNAYMLRVTHQSSRMLSCIMFPLFFFFLLFRAELFEVILSPKYLASVPIFTMSILVIPLRAYGFTTILQNKHKGAIINAGAIGDLLLACVLMYPLYRWIALPGIALAFVISSYVQAGYYLYHTAKTLGMQVSDLVPYGNWILKLLIYGTAYTSAYFLLAKYFTDINMLVSAMALTVLTILISLGIELKMLRQKKSVE